MKVWRLLAQLFTSSCEEATAYDFAAVEPRLRLKQSFW